MKSGCLNLLEPSEPHRACYGTTFIFIYLHDREGDNFTFLLLQRTLKYVKLHIANNPKLRQWIRQIADTEHHIPVMLFIGQVQIFNIFLDIEPRGFPISP
jgi:hypothetical protein